MLEVILIRHGQTDWNKGKRVMGRRPIPLNAAGRRESEAIAVALKDVEIHSIYTSPVLRALQTTRLIVRTRRLKLEMAPEATEVDYGLWVGRTFDDISHDKAYKVYRTTPRQSQAPGGEKMTDVSRRGVDFIEKLKKKHKKGRIAVVSHADLIKAILVYYLGMDLNDMLRLRIDNASMSVLTLSSDGAKVSAINCTPIVGRLFDGLQTDQFLPPARARP